MGIDLHKTSIYCMSGEYLLDDTAIVNNEIESNCLIVIVVIFMVWLVFMSVKGYCSGMHSVCLDRLHRKCKQVNSMKFPNPWSTCHNVTGSSVVEHALDTRRLQVQNPLSFNFSSTFKLFGHLS